MVLSVSSLTIPISAAVAIAGAGWGAHEYLHGTFAEREVVILAGSKADYVLDRQIQGIMRDIERLESKPNKNAADLENLRYLREVLKEMQEVRRGKK